MSKLQSGFTHLFILFAVFLALIGGYLVFSKTEASKKPLVSTNYPSPTTLVDRIQPSEPNRERKYVNNTYFIKYNESTPELYKSLNILVSSPAIDAKGNIIYAEGKNLYLLSSTSSEPKLIYQKSEADIQHIEIKDDKLYLSFVNFNATPLYAEEIDETGKLIYKTKSYPYQLYSVAVLLKIINGKELVMVSGGDGCGGGGDIYYNEKIIASFGSGCAEGPRFIGLVGNKLLMASSAKLNDPTGLMEYYLNGIYSLDVETNTREDLFSVPPNPPVELATLVDDNTIALNYVNGNKTTYQLFDIPTKKIVNTFSPGEASIRTIIKEGKLLFLNEVNGAAVLSEREIKTGNVKTYKPITKETLGVNRLEMYALSVVGELNGSPILSYYTSEISP